MIYCFSKYECQGDATKISTKLTDVNAIDKIIHKYSYALIRYYRKWTKKNTGKEYNDMIKSQLDMEIMEDAIEEANDHMSMM